MIQLFDLKIKDIVKNALLEDINHGDITTDLTIDPSLEGKARIIAKENGIIAGIDLARLSFTLIDPNIEIKSLKKDGDIVEKGDEILLINGKLRSILISERVALNFLQRLSGIATTTRKYVKLIEDTGCKLVDTRKTTPGLRILEKYAVRVGGGYNHRFGLSDGILIKDNHILACGSIQDAIFRAKKNKPHTLLIEIEISNIPDIKIAIDCGVDAILLDNFTVNELKEAVRFARSLKKDIILEASGGINETNIRDYALTGVDLISSGALTHSSKALDLSLQIIYAKR